MTKLLLTSALVCLMGGTALAQDDMMGDDMGGGGMGGGSTMNTTAAETGGGGEPQMGIQADFNSSSGIGAAHFLYNVGGNYLDLIVGINLINVSPEVGDGTTVFELDLGLGYRMYNDMDGRIHPYLEPFVNFGLSTDEATGEPKNIGAGAMLGVDFMLFDQFTLGAQVGGALNFQLTEPANTLSIGLFTSSINATFWWG